MVWAVPRIAAYEKQESDCRDCCGTVIFTVGIITVFVFLFFLWDGVLMTANPEFYALKEILQVF